MYLFILFFSSYIDCHPQWLKADLPQSTDSENLWGKLSEKPQSLFLIIHPLHTFRFFFLLQKNEHPEVPFPSSWLEPSTQPGPAGELRVKDVKHRASLPVLLLLLWDLKSHLYHKSICTRPLCKDEFYLILKNFKGNEMYVTDLHPGNLASKNRLPIY